MTETFTFDRYVAGSSLYARVFNAAGQVFDFSDNTFKALAGATTPYVAATEHADLDGTGYSGYSVAIDLDLLNPSGSRSRFALKFYDNATPAAADQAVSGAKGFTIQFGELGERDVVPQVELSVKSTEGLAAQLSAWLEHGGRKVAIGSVDAAATASITVREHGSGVDLFTLAFTAADLNNDVFEKEQATPGFTDDRQYEVEVSITENGNTYTTTHSRVVLG
jgi:hypothetical protein